MRDTSAGARNGGLTPPPPSNDGGSSNDRTLARKTLSSLVPRSLEFTVLNLKRWPRDLDRRVKIEAAHRGMTKLAWIIEAVISHLQGRWNR